MNCKKIIIVNNNMDFGGIQKSLINLLKAVSSEYDITLLLFSKTGALMSEIPDGVRIVSPSGCYKMLGLSKKELMRYPHLFLLKALLKVLSKIFGKGAALKITGMFQKSISGYDIAVSYSHLTGNNSFDNGCAEFVLDKVNAGYKACFVHCDYGNSGYCSEVNNGKYHSFDKILCVSESVRKKFLEIVPDLSGKTAVMRNFYDPDILDEAKKDPVIYNESVINLVSVARLSPEKGIDRALSALKASGRKDIRMHVIGDGPQRKYLTELCSSLDLGEQVSFYGEKDNPYRFMVNADFLLVSSLHEAAPMVFDEAHMLGLSVISTELLSSAEMLNEYDLECENSTGGITNVLTTLRKKEKIKRASLSNGERFKSFSDLVEGENNDKKRFR